MFQNIFKTNSADIRSSTINKNILALIVIKALNVAINMYLIALTVDLLNPMKYGIWVTLSSIIGWFGLFDIGLGNGLRNKFTEAKTIGNDKLIRVYVSTTYAIISIIILSVFLILIPFNYVLELSKIFNVPNDVNLENDLKKLFLIVFFFFGIRFILKLLTTILTADQKPAKASLFDLFGKAISLGIILLFGDQFYNSLLFVGISLTAAPVLILVVASIYYYGTKYRSYIPSIKFIQLNKTKDLLNIGLKFFFIQISAILLYQTNNIIIAQLFGPSEVTPYNIAFNYFLVLNMGFSIILTPYWSAVTQAWAAKDLFWISKSLKKLKIIWLLFLLAFFVMLLVSKEIYQLWIGKKIQISLLLSFLVGLWTIINSWNSIFSNFLNGIGKIQLQLYVGFIAALLNVPLSIYLGRQFGVYGVLTSNILLGIIGAFIFPLQLNKILNHNSKGIFNK